jgi:hypothetical protein
MFIKRYGLIFALAIGLLKAVKADTPPTDVSQVAVTLLQHVTAVSEFTTHGQTKVQFLDGIFQAGHYQGDYIAAIDGGVSNSLVETGHLAGTAGIHVHVISFLNNFFGINPSLGQTLSMLEVTPRYSYDWDVRHGVLGFTFGARIPFQ